MSTVQNTTLRPTYQQDWRSYNLAQTHEKEHVAALLRSLCEAIESPAQHRGRPRIPLADAVFSAAMKVYSTTSGRRAMSDMRELERKGFIDKAPSYNSIFNALENPALTPILKTMIEESARPLREVETDFAVDSSGFATASYVRWFDVKYGKAKTRCKWLKAHVMIGVKTNVVTSVEVTGGFESDSPRFGPLVRSTAQRFKITKVSADKAYSAKRNLRTISAAGAFPLVPFRDNATGLTPPFDALWKRMYDFYVYNRDEFMQHYHQRSNVETTFSMIKAKFGAYVRSKTPTAQRNELLCKVLCHNLCVLVQSLYELGIEPTFWAAA